MKAIAFPLVSLVSASIAKPVIGGTLFSSNWARNALLKSAKKIKSESFQEILTNLDDYSINRTGEEK